MKKEIQINTVINKSGFHLFTDSLNGVCVASGETFEVAKEDFLKAFSLHLEGAKKDDAINVNHTINDFKYVFLDKELVFCNTCLTNFKTSEPNYMSTPCNCGKVYCDSNSLYVRIMGEEEDFTYLNLENSFM